MSFLSLSIIGVEKFLSVIGNMASKRAGSKDTVERNIGDVVDEVSMSLPVYEDTHMFIDKYIKITWQDINTIHRQF